MKPLDGPLAMSRARGRSGAHPALSAFLGIAFVVGFAGSASAHFCGDHRISSDATHFETCDPTASPQFPANAPSSHGPCRAIGTTYECTFCGDGVKQGNEQCDDGNSNDFDSCKNNCTRPSTTTTVHPTTTTTSTHKPTTTTTHTTTTSTHTTSTTTSTHTTTTSSTSTTTTSSTTTSTSTSTATTATSTTIPDHYVCYNSATGEPNPPVVTLQDQFETAQFKTKRCHPKAFCAPASKNGSPVGDPATHFKGYMLRRIASSVPEPRITADVTNQFGTIRLTTKKASGVLVPSSKSLAPPAPAPLDPAATGNQHYKCYAVTGQSFAPIPVTVQDQFGTHQLTLLRPVDLCTPASKDGSLVKDP